MQQTVNLPIQLISSCSTIGRFTPLRFRYENDNHELITVNILETLDSHECHFAGVNENVYTCTALIDDQKQMFEIKYNIAQHKWVLSRLLS